MLSYAEEQELKPLWIANFVASKISNKEPISYEDFIKSVFGDEESTTKTNSTSFESIEDEFMRIADIERAKTAKEV